MCRASGFQIYHERCNSNATTAETTCQHVPSRRCPCMHDAATLQRGWLTSKLAGRGLPGPARTEPTCLKLGVMGRSHSAAQSTGAIVITCRLRSSGSSGLKSYRLLCVTHRHLSPCTLRLSMVSRSCKRRGSFCSKSYCLLHDAAAALHPRSFESSTWQGEGARAII